MDKNQALKLALEALEEPREHIAKHRRLEAITAIKEALAQPEQEPVAWANLNELSEQIKRVNCGTVYGQPPELIRFGWQSVYGQPPEAKGSQPLYTAPLQRKPLTDEQLIAVYESEQRGRYGDHIRSLRAIEAAHGIKE